MENAIMVGVLLAVVGVGLFGLYYANTADQTSTMYVPVITGMATTAVQTANFSVSSIYSIENTGCNVSGNLVINLFPVDPTEEFSVDNWGECNNCTAEVVSGPIILDFMGIAGNNVTALGCKKMKTNVATGGDGTANLTVAPNNFVKKVYITTQLFGDLPGGAVEYYPNNNPSGFNTSAALELTTLPQTIYEGIGYPENEFAHFIKVVFNANTVPAVYTVSETFGIEPQPTS